NLNRIIRLQAVLEIISSKTANAVDLLNQQSRETCTVILQHCMVLDYLLAEEGRLCGKL
ncbi:ENR1 protein, partial [Ramphastos sulfuratus]|nr:ENR1 protein [Ramphastos sulfuratus]